MESRYLMKIKPLLACLICWCLLSLASYVGAVQTEVFSTRFEASEGYSTNAPLIRQNGWVGDGSGGNGIVSEFFDGQGQQAYVGFFPPETNDDQLIVWRPVNYSPTNASLVQFSVLMAVVDSYNTNYDNFRWSMYNSRGDRLFSLDFDNYDLSVNYLLDGTNELVATDQYFSTDERHTLVVSMNFASNKWSATLDDLPVVTNKAITTTNALRDLGDVDAVWLVYDPAAPGDNYLLFDNYSITAELRPPAAPQLKLVERTPSGNVSLRLFGTSGLSFAVDASTNLASWTALKTNVLSGGYFDYLDTSATALNRRFYRARWVP